MYSHTARGGRLCSSAPTGSNTLITFNTEYKDKQIMRKRSIKTMSQQSTLKARAGDRLQATDDTSASHKRLACMRMNRLCKATSFSSAENKGESAGLRTTRLCKQLVCTPEGTPESRLLGEDSWAAPWQLLGSWGALFRSKPVEDLHPENHSP